MRSTLEPKSPRDAPTFSECVVGYRTWFADSHVTLWPIAKRRRPWVPGVNEARCKPGSWPSLRFEWSLHHGRRVLEPVPEHRAPDPDCECGLYSLRYPPARWQDDPRYGAPPHVIGAVASWGLIQVHPTGFRAEYACVVSLAYHPGADPEKRAALERIAHRYRADLVPVAELERAASRHGTPLPDTLPAQPAEPGRA